MPKRDETPAGLMDRAMTQIETAVERGTFRAWTVDDFALLQRALAANEREFCPVCGGDGELTSPNVNHGPEECEECDGTGFAPEKKRARECEPCEGLGIVIGGPSTQDCRWCRGTGKVDL